MMALMKCVKPVDIRFPRLIKLHHTITLMNLVPTVQRLELSECSVCKSQSQQETENVTEAHAG